MKVHIVGSGTMEYKDMFVSKKWEIVQNIQAAHLVQFTGGEDVSPELYGAYAHHKTYNSRERDAIEIAIFLLALKLQKPMAGICRGGQFLNVMCGGTMYQHVDGHALAGTHEVLDVTTKKTFQGTSTHHQMIAPTKEAKVIAVASNSTIREWYEGKKPYVANKYKTLKDPIDTLDTEAVYYSKQKCLCFQPHPEFKGYTDLKNIYFEYLERYLLGDL